MRKIPNLSLCLRIATNANSSFAIKCPFPLKSDFENKASFPFKRSSRRCDGESLNSLTRNNCNWPTIFCNVKIAFEGYGKMNLEERTFDGKQVYVRD